MFFGQACKSKNEQSADSPFYAYGDSIDLENSVDVATLPALLAGYDSIACNLRGQISEVCQTKGCWMSMPIGDNDDLFIKFKDYAFFVPMNASGREAVVQGFAYVDTVSVSELQHIAQDAGKEQDEIESIDQPEVRYTFMADAVRIK
jgi:hypothetical protein